SMTDPFTDLEINCRSQLSILEACRRHNPDVKVVFASTRQIYGRPRYLPVDEEHPVAPVDVNGIDKAAGEAYHLLYGDVYGLRLLPHRPVPGGAQGDRHRRLLLAQREDPRRPRLGAGGLARGRARADARLLRRARRGVLGIAWGKPCFPHVAPFFLPWHRSAR